MGHDSLKKRVTDYLTQALPAQGQIPYRVLMAYPEKLALLPCVSVTQTAGGLDAQHIGEVIEEAHQRADGEYVETIGALYRQGLEITLWTVNPITRDQDTMIIRQALWQMLRHLSRAHGIVKVALNEAGDGQDLDGRAPQTVFSFSWSISALVQISLDLPVPVADGLEVSVEWEAK